MAHTSSVSTSLAVVAAAQAAPTVVATLPGVPGAPALPPGLASAADFLGQFKVALKNLTKAVNLPHLGAQRAEPAAGQAATTEAEPVSTKPVDAQPADKKTEAPLPDVLATFGLIPGPVAFQAPAPAPERSKQAPSSPILPDEIATARQVQPLPKSTPEPTAPESPAAEAHIDMSKLPKPDVQLPKPDLQLPIPEAPLSISADQSESRQPGAAPRKKTRVGATTTDKTAPPATRSPRPTPVETTRSTPSDPTSLAPGTLLTASQTPARHQGPALAPATDEPTVQRAGAPQSARHGPFQQGSADDGQQPNSTHGASAADTSARQGVPVVSDAAIVAAASSTVSNSVTVVPTHVEPAQVVAQIAHQADLYRLPGNRGLRIQLHPEGLGGVEVTMRYGAGGALQLHINVEHAATGSLVQAGWTQLRDALANQGISPERLVMSVTAPTSSSQLDFSGNGTGRQPDPGLASFAQNQSGQQRQEQPEQTGPRGWNSAGAPSGPADDSPRVASTTAATSRIDYRA